MPVVKIVVEKNLMRDSLQLMKISEELKKLPGVMEAVVAMGTETNKEIARDLGVYTPELEEVGEDDLFIAIKAQNEEALQKAIEQAREWLTKPPESGETEFIDIDMALSALPDANLALVSVPGEYARDVSMKFLEKGIHVHLFSDHVPKEHEVELKKYAYEKGLLVLGPGAGTSIINGIAIAFANAVRRGPIGIVAAAGTGLQEVSTLIHRMGLGVSQGLGVGGGDVKDYVGGIMTKLAFKMLDQDPETSVLTFVSKPPDQATMESILGFLSDETKKPIVLGIMGKVDLKIPENIRGRTLIARTLHATALGSVKLVDEELYRKRHEELTIPFDTLREKLALYWEKLSEKQKYIRGLFTGGTLTSEALMLMDALGLEMYSNAPLKGQKKLKDPFKSVQNTIVDLGEEEFTAGRAHPMIDPTIRRIRLIEEAKDPETAVVLMDFVLGYGSNPDPVGAHLDAIKKAKEIARNQGNELIFVAYVLGVEEDPQRMSDQVSKLEKAGVIVMPTNAMASLSAALIASRGNLDSSLIREVYEEYLRPVNI